MWGDIVDINKITVLKIINFLWEKDGNKMKKKAIVMMMLGMICFTACGNQNLSNKGTEIKSVETQSTEKVSQEEPSTEQERLKTTDFSNLSKVADQVGFSFRALESLDADDDENNSFKFQNFSISTEKETEINGMQLDEPSYVVKLDYKKRGLIEATVTMFKYDGDNIQSAIHNPNCYIETIKINGIDVNRAEYVIHLVPSDYVLTDEDRAYIKTGKGDFSCDGMTEGDSYFDSLYWTEDGTYYEIEVLEENYSIETMKKMVQDIMCTTIW